MGLRNHILIMLPDLAAPSWCSACWATLMSRLPPPWWSSAPLYCPSAPPCFQSAPLWCPSTSPNQVAHF